MHPLLILFAVIAFAIAWPLLVAALIEALRKIVELVGT